MTTITSNARAYLNFAYRLRRFLKNPISEVDVRGNILEQLSSREENFVRVLRTNVFGYPRSPYLPLLNAARLTHADVERMVADQGIEGALEELFEANVYFKFEEFKGRVAVKRGGIELKLDDRDFDNPFINPVLAEHSSGSTGNATAAKLDLDFIGNFSEQVALCELMHGAFGAPQMIWWAILPGASAVTELLRLAHFGQTMARWFAPLDAKDYVRARYYSFMTSLLVSIMRFHGHRCPRPEFLPLSDPLPIAKAAAQTIEASGRASMSTTTSCCARVSLAAVEHGIDLTGLTFIGWGEPITPAKLSAIESSGAKYINFYAAAETGVIGLACRNAEDITDTHFMSNHLALIQRPEEVFDKRIDTFYFSSLLPSNPKMMLNVQFDDFGIIEDRDCGCELQHLGLTRHIRQVGSFRKLTVEGLALVGTDMVKILEHDLPSELGGDFVDYQIVEEENEQGLTKLVLIVHPSVPVRDENQLLRAFFAAMENSTPSIRWALAQFRAGNVVEIRRTKPYTTATGKHHPIRTIKI